VHLDCLGTISRTTPAHGLGRCGGAPGGACGLSRCPQTPGACGRLRQRQGSRPGCPTLQRRTRLVFLGRPPRRWSPSEKEEEEEEESQADKAAAPFLGDVKLSLEKLLQLQLGLGGRQGSSWAVSGS